MSNPTTDAILAIILAEAEQAATRLRRRLGLPRSDEEDLRQDLLVDLIARLPAFDARRGRLGALAGRIIRNEASRLAARHCRVLRAQNGPFLSLEAVADGAGLDRTVSGQGAHPQALLADDYLDLRIALARLGRRDQALCNAVALWSVDHLASKGLGSRAGLYRRLRELRNVLTAYGLGAAEDGSVAARAGALT